MEKQFDAEEFYERLASGVFNGRLQDELHKLTYDQLQQVAMVMARRLRPGAAENSAEPKPGPAV